MHYQIKYGCTGDSRRISCIKKWTSRVGVGLCILALCVVFLWSLNGDWAVTVAAMEDMAGAIAQGSGIKDAFGAFCLDILKGAELG